MYACFFSPIFIHIFKNYPVSSFFNIGFRFFAL